MKRMLYMTAALLLCSAVMAEPVTSDQQLKAFEARLTKLEKESSATSASIDKLEKKVSDHGPLFAVLFLGGCFGALWAQNTGRNAWGWFFLCALGGPLAWVVMLTQNSTDKINARIRRLDS